MSWLANRRFLAAMGVAGLALAIWIAGDMLVWDASRPLEAPAARLAAIGALVVLWVLIELAFAWRAAHANRRLLEGIAGSDAGARSRHEVAELARRFQEASVVLKKTRFRDARGERRFLHELPWYVFIGAPGSGKTTALINSGLHFVLGGRGRAVKGIGGTRNCDWWFTEEAVLLDTAGRYTTQDSERGVDAAAWNGFLDLLKRFRKRAPLSGAIVTLSVSDLLHQSAEERERYAEQVSTRLDEFYQRLGVRFPVYLLVTKMDLLAGFNEFLGELDRGQRTQVWGMTFDDPRHGKGAAGTGAVFAAEFVGLERRLYGHLLERLQPVRDQQRRSLIYSFPQEFSTIGQLIAGFVDSTFGSVSGTATPILRGVYFTSGTQEGTPIDRVLGTLARAFHLERKVLPPSLSSGKSYFLTKLLRDVIFREAGLAGSDEKKERRTARMARAATAAALAATVVVLVLWSVSFFENRSMILEASARAKALEKVFAPAQRPDADLASVVSLLNGLRNLPDGYAERHAASWSRGFGLYQGDELGDLAVQAYRNALRDVFLPRVAALIEQRLRNARSHEELRKALNAYLMLYYDQLFDPNTLEQSAASVVDVVLAASGKTALRGDLTQHLKASLAMRPFEMIRPRNEALIATARRRMNGS